MSRGLSAVGARGIAAAGVLTSGVVATHGSLTTLAVGLGAVALAGSARRKPEIRPGDHDRALERHLARARRMNVAAELAVVRGVDPGEIVELLRAADSMMVRGDGSLVLLTEGGDVDRHAFERRLETRAGTDFEVSWAAFPADGYTLTDLVACADARSSQREVAAPHGVPASVSLFPSRTAALADGRAA